MNMTISVDERLLNRARAHAAAHGKSLQHLIRVYLENLVGERAGKDFADELIGLMNEHGGHSGGRRIRREDAYEGRI